MLTLGRNFKTNALATTAPSDVKLHTLVLGQSGSGKSFFLARMLEEILLRTKARVVALDPNGDFETFFAPREEEFWTEGSFADKLSALNSDQISIGNKSFDDLDAFVDGWKKLRFQHIISGRQGRMPLAENAFGAPLKLHWKYLSPELQDYLLGMSDGDDPTVSQGIAACHYYANRHRKNFPKGVSLRDLEDIASLFETKKVAATLREYDIAISLKSTDWTRVRTRFRMIRKRYSSIFYLNRLGEIDPGDSIATDLGGYIFRGYRNPGLSPEPAWNFMSISLAGAASHHSLLSAYVTLQNIWFNSIATWRKAREERMEAVKASVIPTGPDLGEFDEVDDGIEPEIARLGETEIEDMDDQEEEEAISKFGNPRPTFIVIDEAHNFAPEISDNPLQQKVSDLIATIAAEGRKYNIFLVISTQRPGKIRKGLAAECENVAVLRLQSSIEREHLVANTTITSNEANRMGELQPGQAIVSGRWFPDSPTVSFAPARTFLGGENLSDAEWIYEF